MPKYKECPNCHTMLEIRTSNQLSSCRCPVCGLAVPVGLIEQSEMDYSVSQPVIMPAISDKVSAASNYSASKPASRQASKPATSSRTVLKKATTFRSDAIFIQVSSQTQPYLDDWVEKNMPLEFCERVIDDSLSDFFLKSVISEGLVYDCILSNYIDTSDPTLNRRNIAIHILNSRYIQLSFPEGYHLKLMANLDQKGIVWINQMDIVSNMPLTAVDIQTCFSFYYVKNHYIQEDRYRIAKKFLTDNLSKTSSFNVERKDELQHWDDYLVWKNKLAGLKICSAKYIGREIHEDRDENIDGIVFLAIAANEDEYKAVKRSFEREKDGLAIYGNGISTNRWKYSYNENSNISKDKGFNLPYVEAVPVKNWESELSVFSAHAAYDYCRRESDEFRNPYLFKVVFTFDTEDWDLFDLKEFTNEQIKKWVNNNILKNLKEEGFIATARIGDFALNKRLTRAIQDLKQGHAVSPNLGNWLFDIKAANSADDYSINDIHWSEWGKKNLNESQKKVIAKMLAAPDVFLCQGPPGTGKTTVIAEAVYQMVKRGQRVLISSQTNLAVNNALSILISRYTDIRAVRLGSDRKIDESVSEIAQDAIVKTYFKKSSNELRTRYIDKWDRDNKELEEIDEGLRILQEINSSQDYTEKNEETRKIQGEINELTKELTVLVQNNEIDQEKINRINELIGRKQIATTKKGQIEESYKRELETQLGDLLKKYNADSDNLKRILDYRRTQIKESYVSWSLDQTYGSLIRNYVSYVEKQGDNFDLENDKYFRDYINSCNVVGVSCTENTLTLTQNGFNSFDVTIIDEVSKATPPELLIPLLLSGKAVFVGDHRQLPPLFNEHINSYEEYKANIDDEDEETKRIVTDENYRRFEELVTNSLFRRHFEEADEMNKESLLTQYRMHSEIMSVINNFYNGKLNSGLSPDSEIKEKAHNVNIKGTYGITNIISPKHHAYWIDSSSFMGKSMYEESANSSKTNYLEALLITKTVQDIDNSYDVAGWTGQIEVGIISFYNAQVKLIRELISKKCILKHVKTDINTVDRFQGKEKPIVLVSLVRNVPEGRNYDPTFVNMYQRINVAFSRAQKLLLIFGSKDMYYDQQINIEDMNTGTACEPTNVYGKIIDLLNSRSCYLRSDDILGKEYSTEILEHNERNRRWR